MEAGSIAGSDGSTSRADRALLLFSLDDDDHAVEAAGVIEVVRAVSVTPLPGAPPPVRGAVDVRGVIAPVLDCRQCFGMAPGLPAPSEHFIIVRTAARLVVLAVDRVTDLVAVADTDLDREPATTAAHVVAIVRRPGGLVQLHDVAALLAPAEDHALGVALERAAASGAR